MKAEALGDPDTGRRVDEDHGLSGTDVCRADRERPEPAGPNVLAELAPVDVAADQRTERSRVEDTARPAHCRPAGLGTGPPPAETPNPKTCASSRPVQTDTRRRIPAGTSWIIEATNAPLTAPTLVPEISSTAGGLPVTSPNSLKMYSRTPTSYAPRAPPPESISPRPLNARPRPSSLTGDRRRDRIPATPGRHGSPEAAKSGHGEAVEARRARPRHAAKEARRGAGRAHARL